MHGHFAWNELMTDDVEKAKAFYAAALGWSFESFPMENSQYWVAKAGDAPVAGLMAIEDVAPGAPPHWFAYVEVDDIDARVAAAEREGGTVLRAPFDVPGVGRIAILRDPTGAAMGWMTSAAPAA
ncbi:VOC family protein [Chelatococcus sp. SYSU_G07232]|uniref:VOC family protein n=1 Tax=Chelatococcus albus TaxID=3047466 RepID=A0ABT7AJF7_9HYPH|nr:VOC family protein [Chelatococcus sp. SYSU_G07232]MDJ1159493.1 VOC family protein [Chelatococcus sp. SYSU_G07232]